MDDGELKVGPRMYQAAQDEIARLTAALEAKGRQSEAAGRSYRRAREVITKCAEALGNGAYVSPLASLEFAENLPSEIGLHVASLVEDRDTWKERATAAEARLAKACEALKQAKAKMTESVPLIGYEMHVPAFIAEFEALAAYIDVTLQEIGENNAD